MALVDENYNNCPSTVEFKYSNCKNNAGIDKTGCDSDAETEYEQCNSDALGRKDTCLEGVADKKTECETLKYNGCVAEASNKKELCLGPYSAQKDTCVLNADSHFMGCNTRVGNDFESCNNGADSDYNTCVASAPNQYEQCISDKMSDYELDRKEKLDKQYDRILYKNPYKVNNFYDNNCNTAKSIKDGLWKSCAEAKQDFIAYLDMHLDNFKNNYNLESEIKFSIYKKKGRNNRLVEKQNKKLDFDNINDDYTDRAKNKCRWEPKTPDISQCDIDKNEAINRCQRVFDNGTKNCTDERNDDVKVCDSNYTRQSSGCVDIFNQDVNRCEDNKNKYAQACEADTIDDKKLCHTNFNADKKQCSDSKIGALGSCLLEFKDDLSSCDNDKILDRAECDTVKSNDTQSCNNNNNQCIIDCGDLIEEQPGLDLADEPLFASIAVPPNILFIVDDSGSMDWETTAKNHWTYYAYNYKDSGYFKKDGLIKDDGDSTKKYLKNSSSRDDFILLKDGENEEKEWRFTASSLNRTYYDPSVSYKPWVGGGYANSDFNNAKYDPNYSSKRNLNGFIYTVWKDSHGFSGSRPNFGTKYNRAEGANGLVDYWDDYIKYTVKDNEVVVDYMSYDLNVKKAKSIRTEKISGAMKDIYGRTVSEIKQNVANWFSYSKKREFVMKGAMSDVVNDSTSRIGLLGLNNSYAFTEVKDINTITNRNEQNKVNKEKLLNNIHKGNSSGGTPLRKALNNGGKYYEGKYTPNKKTYGSPIEFSCQKNYSLLLTDGFYTKDPPSGIANEDGDKSTVYDSTGSYADAYSQTLADVAMYYYENDLSSMDNNVPINKVNDDLNSAQHMNTFTLSFGLEGTLAANPVDRSTPFAWPKVVKNTSTTIDDMRHAAWNGRGEFSIAGNSEDLKNSLKNSLAKMEQKGNSSSVSFNSSKLGTNTNLYIALFNSVDWSGDVLSYKIDLATKTVYENPEWSAANELNKRDIVTEPRQIMSYESGYYDSNNTFQLKRKGIKFDASAMTAQSLMFKDLSVGAGTIAQKVEYLSGDKTLSGSTFRLRQSRLGDIVHSTPIFVSKPKERWPSPVSYKNCGTDVDNNTSYQDIFPAKVIDCKANNTILTNTYEAFKVKHDGRDGVVYFGGNDGMVHALNWKDGKEIFAYMPEFLTSEQLKSGYHYLTDKEYEHKYYVDMPLMVADAYIDHDGDSDKEWRTLLVGGARAGGRGIFVLDITNTDYDVDDVNWGNTVTGPSELPILEFSHKDYPNMGYSFSEPTVVPIEYDGKKRWAVIFGNGYNSMKEGGGGSAQLIALFLDADIATRKNGDRGWTLGEDFIVIDTETGAEITDVSKIPRGKSNGLSSIATVDNKNNDSIADIVYAGDLNGDIWKFDLSSLTTSKLFDGIEEQPITSIVNIVTNDAAENGSDPNTLVLFGTGQYIETSDILNKPRQMFAAVWDNGSIGITKSDLKERTYTKTRVGNADYRVMDSLDADNNGIADDPDFKYVATGGSKMMGWYIDLNDGDGERVFTNSVVRGDIVYFNTSIPSKDVCEVGGTGWLMSVTSLYGGEPNEPIIDVDQNGKVDYKDVIDDPKDPKGPKRRPSGQHFEKGMPSAPAFLDDQQFTPGTNTNDGSDILLRGVEDVSLGTGRTSWREINPYLGY